jgi:hypothetical protein
MKKLQLDIEALRVDSFEAGTTEVVTRGTVQANVRNQDIPHNESEGLACATDGFNYCNAPTAGGCVSYTSPNFSDCCYEITSLC